jgi:hypothetical protein
MEEGGKLIFSRFTATSDIAMPDSICFAPIQKPGNHVKCKLRPYHVLHSGITAVFQFRFLASTAASVLMHRFSRRMSTGSALMTTRLTQFIDQ